MPERVSVCVCVCVCVCGVHHIGAGILRDQKKALGRLELELQALCSNHGVGAENKTEVPKWVQIEC